MAGTKSQSPVAGKNELPDQTQPNPSEQVICDIHHNESSRENVRSGSQQTFSLNISPSYVEDWDTTAAFRELYQNWRDAILEEFDIDRLEFQPLYEERADCIAIIVPDLSNQHERCQALGFIRYDKMTGQTILVNPCAQLKPEALDLGNSSKRVNTNLTGCHGEGLKLAALVMSRNGHSIKVTTANSHWNFSFSGSRFRCTIRPSRMMNSAPETDPTKDMARMQSNIERDVMVEIAPARGNHGQKISIATFQTWVKVTLDIRGISYPSHVIETDAGDLILDPRYSGRIYLKGMLLPAAFSELKPYKLGYNFIHGRVNRDRQILVDKHEEANAVRRIWESAIRKNEKAVLPIYIDFLQNFPEAPDVESADILLTDDTKALIWRQLLCKAGGKKFYYSEKSHAQSIGVIRDSLRKEPTRLPELLWNLLRSNSLLRTPEEEQIEHFRNAKISAPPGSSFGRTIQRALKACLALFPWSKNIEVYFVQSQGIGVDIFFDAKQNVLKIHERWLNFQEIHRGNPCREFFPTEMAGEDDPFFCEHVIDELFRISCNSILRHSSMSRAFETRILRQVRLFLRYMPHNIKVIPTFQAGCLKVTWEDNETESFRNSPVSSISYHIVLHEEKCVNAGTELLHGDTVTWNAGHAPCGCPHKFASQNNKVALFHHLDRSSSYYPTVALNRLEAFYGMPPQPSVPTLSSTIPQLKSVQTASEVTGTQPIKIGHQFEFQQDPLPAQNRFSAGGMQAVNHGAQFALMQQQQAQMLHSQWQRARLSRQMMHAGHAAEISQTSPKRELETSHDVEQPCHGKLAKLS